MALPAAGAIERAGLRCWPGLEAELDGAWIRRAANGYSKRANSVQSLDAADDGNAPARIEAARRWFAARSLPAVFRLTPLAGPGIVAALDAAGWRSIDASRLLAMELISMPADPRAKAYHPLDARFTEAQQRLAGLSEETVGKLAAVLRAIDVPARGMVLHAADGRALAASLVAVADGIVFTGNVVTDAAERRRGHGAAMMRAGLAWAHAEGARIAALNVAAGNLAAAALYRRLGYAAQYKYCYRVPPA